MTKEMALRLLKHYRWNELPEPKHFCYSFWGMDNLKLNAYTEYLLGEVIRKIELASPLDDPIEIIHEFSIELTRPIENSSNPITKRMRASIFRILLDMTYYLEWEEHE